EDDLLRGGRGDAAEAARRVVELPRLLVLAGLLGGLQGPDGDVAGGAVQFDPCPGVRTGSPVVRDEEGRLDRLDQQVERDLLLPHQPAQGTHVDVHGYASSFFNSPAPGRCGSGTVTPPPRRRRRSCG